jgi:hypothetical protein
MCVCVYMYKDDLEQLGMNLVGSIYGPIKDFIEKAIKLSIL